MSEQDATLDEFTDDAESYQQSRSQAASRFWGMIPKEWEIADPDTVYEVNPNPESDEEPNTYIEMDALDTELPWPRYFGKRKASDYSGKTFTAGDTLFARITPCTENGKAALVPEIKTQIGIGSTEFAVLSPNRERILPWYLFYVAKSHPVHNYAVSRMRGSTGRQRVPFSVFRRELDIALPPFEEQRKIASVLYTVDQAIQKTEEIREKAKSAEEVAKTELFTHGYSEWDVQESVGWRCRANQVPKDWDVKTADELMEITRGASPRPRSDDSLFDGDIPWIKIGDANRDESKRIEEVDSYVTEKGKNRSKFVEEGTLLVANSGATCGFSIFAGVDGCVHDGWLILRGYDDFSPDFLYHYINWNYDYLQSLSLGSAQTNLSTSLFGRLDIPVPVLQEQQQIVDALDSISEVVAHASTEINRLQCLKQGLMQDLLSGEIRTHDKDIEVVDEVLQYG